MAASSLTSEAPNHGRARGRRSSLKRRARAASCRAGLGWQQQQGIFKRMTTRGSSGRTASAAAANHSSSCCFSAGAANNQVPQKKQLITRKWESTEEVKLSQLILAFKLHHGRLPAGVLTSSADKHFWTACARSHFHGCFTYKQLREKMRRLVHRFAQLSSGHAKSIKLSEKDTFNIWCLITAPPSQLPAGVVPPSTFPYPTDGPEPVTPSSPLHQAGPPASDVTGMAAQGAESAEGNGNDATEESSQQYSAENEYSSSGNGGYDQDTPKAVAVAVAVASTYNSSDDHNLEDKLGQAGSWKKRGDAEHTQEYENKGTENENGDVDEASSGAGGEGVEYAENSSWPPKTAIADLASTTKVLAEATLCTTSTTKVLAEAAVAATSTTSVLAHTTQMLVQMLLINSGQTSAAGPGRTL